MKAWWLGKWGQMTAFKRIVFCLLFFGSLSFLFVPINPGYSRWNMLIPMAVMWLFASLAVPGSHVPIVARIAALPIFAGLIGQGFSDIQNGKVQFGLQDIGQVLIYFVYVWMSGFIVWKGRLPNTTI